MTAILFISSIDLNEKIYEGWNHKFNLAFVIFVIIKPEKSQVEIIKDDLLINQLLMNKFTLLEFYEKLKETKALIWMYFTDPDC